MSRRVLVVDDEKNIRTTLADILEGEGFDVCTANTGEKAVKLCQRRKFDLVLMDVRMPGIDGFEAMQRIRAWRNNVDVIMMSAYSMTELQQAALDRGAVAFLRKPLDPQQVISLVGRARGD